MVTPHELPAVDAMLARGVGLVLAGGRSSRMGTSKAHLPFGPETLLQRSVRILAGIFPRVIVSAAQGQELPALPSEVAIVRDEKPDAGPIQGLRAGLRALPDSADYLYLTACDQPFVTRAWIEMQAQSGAPWLGALDDPAAFLSARGWLAQLTQPGEENAGYGRWRLPVIPMSQPELPHTWYVTARKRIG